MGHAHGLCARHMRTAYAYGLCVWHMRMALCVRSMRMGLMRWECLQWHLRMQVPVAGLRDRFVVMFHVEHAPALLRALWAWVRSSQASYGCNENPGGPEPAAVGGQLTSGEPNRAESLCAPGRAFVIATLEGSE